MPSSSPVSGGGCFGVFRVFSGRFAFVKAVDRELNHVTLVRLLLLFLFVGQITVDGAEGKSRNNDVRRVRRVAQLPSPALGCCLLFLFHLLYELYLYDMMHAVRV